MVAAIEQKGKPQRQVPCPLEYDMTPRHPRPANERVEAALKDLYAYLRNCEAGQSIGACTLVIALAHRGHSRRAAMWAVYEVALTGALRAIPATVFVVGKGLRRCNPPKHAPVAWSEIELQLQADWEEMVGQRVTSTGRPVQTGPCTFKIGDEVYHLTPNEAYVLTALVEHGPLPLAELQKRSGVSQPHKVLKRIQRKYPALKPHIHRPGRKGRGGYRFECESPRK